LRTEAEEDIGCLETNMMKLRQILLNLLSNALKFTEQGCVTLSATRTSHKGTECIAFAVKDTGIGIPLDTQEHIYDAFYQADGSYTRKFGGTGLGLSIVSQLTTLLGGTITLKSAPGQGSTFTVLLPIKAVHQYIEQDTPRLHLGQRQEVSTRSPSPHEHVPTLFSEFPQDFVPRGATDGHHHLILAVDDNPDVLVLIKTALQDTSYTVIAEQDALKVMERVQEMRPCAITLDVMMPGLNGWQILHQLRENPATASIPVVMLTVLSEQTTGYVLGADDYVIKPFKKDVLCNTLQRLIDAKQDPS
jgi:CheY-like chemotaxis protein